MDIVYEGVQYPWLRFITDEGVGRPAMGVMEKATRAMRMLMRMLR